MSFYRLSWHQPKFHQFCPKNWPEIIWNFGVIRLLYQVSAHNLITHFISFEELSYVDCQNFAQIYNKDQLIHFTNKPFRVVEIIGIRKDAIHEPIPGHQLGFFLCVTKCCFKSVHIWPSTSWYFIGLNAGAFPHDDQRWIIVRSEALWNAGSCHLVVFHSLWSLRSYTDITNWR